jgi:phosphoserine phosphatase
VATALEAVGVGTDRCVAFGDSMSDAPLLRALSHTVALNADDHLRDLAAATYAGDDLWAAYELGRSLLD